MSRRGRLNVFLPMVDELFTTWLKDAFVWVKLTCRMIKYYREAAQGWKLKKMDDAVKLKKITPTEKDDDYVLKKQVGEDEYFFCKAE